LQNTTTLSNTLQIRLLAKAAYPTTRKTIHCWRRGPLQGPRTRTRTRTSRGQP